MNTGKIYGCKIFLLIHKKNYGGAYPYRRYVKNALVMKDSLSYIGAKYIDIQTGEKYYFGAEHEFVNAGALYIAEDYGLVPYNELIGNTCQNMSKRRVLKKYQEYKNKEIDKE